MSFPNLKANGISIELRGAVSAAMAMAFIAMCGGLGVGSAFAQLPSPPSSPMPVINYEYDAQGNPTKTIQAPGVMGFGFTTQSAYDALDRPTSVTDAKSGVIQFDYNGREEVIQVTDPRSLVTQMPRNGLGDTTSLVSPDTGTATHTYDAAGNLATRTNSLGVLETYTYDALDRLTALAYTKFGGTTHNYTWTYDQTGAGFSNGIGRLTSTTYPAGSASYSHDAQGRVLTDTQNFSAATGANASAIAKTVTYTYDTAGNVTSVNYPSGRKLLLTYTNGKVSEIALSKDGVATPSVLLTQIAFSPFGAPQSWKWPSGSGLKTHERVFDAAGRLIRYPLGRFIRDVTYDDAGRITAYTHYEIATGTATVAALALNQSFAYDELGRLTGATTATTSWSFSYDANGNLNRPGF